MGRAVDDPILPRLRAELGAMGFDLVEMLADDGAPARAALEENARSLGAIAAVRLVPSGGGVEVWIVDRVTGKTVLREIVRPEGPSGEADAMVAMRAVELLRASLLAIH